MKSYNALCNYADFLIKTCDYLEMLIKYSDVLNYKGLAHLFYEDLFQLELRMLVIKHCSNFGDNSFNVLFEVLKK
mgnify:CR=1 FL=1